MAHPIRYGALIGVALLCGLSVFFLIGAPKGGADQVRGIQAGNLYAGNVSGARIPLSRGASEMIGLVFVKNVGSEPIVIQSVKAQSTSRELQTTPVRIWTVPIGAHLTLPNWWPGWPPRHLPTKPPRFAPSWIQPHPDVLSLPTSQVIYPGRKAQLLFGIFLHADPSPKFRISGVVIRFNEGNRAFVWTYPEPVAVYALGHPRQ